MGVEPDALLRDFAQLCEREDLKAAAVGQDGTVPGHELMQAAHLFDERIARADMQVIGVRQLDLTADLLQVARRESALDRALRADVHEDRSLHCAVRRLQLTAPRAALFLFYQCVFSHGQILFSYSKKQASPKLKKR